MARTRVPLDGSGGQNTSARTQPKRAAKMAPASKANRRAVKKVPKSKQILLDTHDGEDFVTHATKKHRLDQGERSNICALEQRKEPVVDKKGLTDQLRARIEEMGFKGLVRLGPTTLDDRDFLCWLMDRFDPETMMLHISGGKVLVVSEYAIHCVLLLPRDGGDPPHTSDESAKLARTNVAAHLFPDNPNPSAVKINPTEVAKLMEKFHTEGVGDFDDDFCLRLFFTVANCFFLTPNTDSYIRIVDAKWCEDLAAISGFNWCKIVFDNLSDVYRKWQLSKKLNKEGPSILGCAMFLIIYYLDNLQIDNGLDPFTTPRCMLYTKEIIKLCSTPIKERMCPTLPFLEMPMYSF